MSKYRVLFENKVLRSVSPTQEEIPANDTFLEETTGSLIWAIIEAASDEEAQQKAHNWKQNYIQVKRKKHFVTRKILFESVSWEL